MVQLKDTARKLPVCHGRSLALAPAHSSISLVQVLKSPHLGVERLIGLHIYLSNRQPRPKKCVEGCTPLKLPHRSEAQKSEAHAPGETAQRKPTVPVRLPRL